MRQYAKKLSAAGILFCVIMLLFSCTEEMPFPMPTLIDDMSLVVPPAKPFNPSPPDSASNVLRATTFSWQGFHEKGDSLVYSMYFNIDTVFGNNERKTDEEPDTTFSVTLLAANTRFYWKVDVKDESGNWEFGDVWTFTTGTTIDNLPAVTILEPANLSQFTIFEAVTFRGSAIDQEDGVLSGSSLVWTSNRQGVIGTDTLFTTTGLSGGLHTITLGATDSKSGFASSSIQVTVIDTTSPNMVPLVSITSPLSGSTFADDDSITFTGSATDPEDGALTGGSLTWISSLDGQVGNGETITISGLSVGSHAITLRATDSMGASGTAIIFITITAAVNTPPVVQIISPPDFAFFAQDSIITFYGTAFDAEDGVLSGGSVTWTSNVDGQIGQDTLFVTTNMSLGVHTITMRAVDSKSIASTDQITITVTPVGVANNPPVATILQPANNAILTTGAPVTFSGTGTDIEDGNIVGNQLTWLSDVEGLIGTGTSFTTSTLSIGKHIITLQVRDSGSKVDTAMVNIFVGAAGNTRPKARFTIQHIVPVSVPPEVNVTLDASIIFDAEDAIDDILIRWDFENDGVWDTNFAAGKTASLQYTSGVLPRYVSLQVKDVSGLADQVTLIVPEMAFVPAGNFNMGSAAGNPPNDSLHTVYLNGYYIDRYEVTNAQFAAFLSDNGNPVYYSSKMRISKESDGSYTAFKGNENVPAAYIDWNAADVFVRWYNKSLPTEAQWEKAARGGSAGNLLPNREYPWGTGLTPSYANYYVIGRPYDGLAPVATYTGQLINGVQTINNASVYGVYDMLGNIAEWVQDYYGYNYYSVSPASNPTGPADGDFKVFRGGSEHTLEADIRISKRFSALPTARPYIVGLRTVINP